MISDLKKLQVDNWLMYIPDNVYCIVHALDPVLKLSRFDNRVFQCSSVELNQILITPNIITIAGFKGASPEYKKQTTTNRYICLVNDNSRWQLFFDIKYAIPVKYVDELQNAYLEITGERLMLNLFGI